MNIDIMPLGGYDKIVLYLSKGKYSVETAYLMELWKNSQKYSY